MPCVLDRPLVWSRYRLAGTSSPRSLCKVPTPNLYYKRYSGSIGPVTQMSQFSNSMGHLSSTQQGVYVACILLSSSLSSLTSGHVSDWMSRKYGILIGGLLSLIGTIVSAASPNFASLVSARIITGLGSGQAISMTTVYLVELASPEIRGLAASLLQLYIVSGITIGYFVAFGSHNLHGSMAWRIPFIFQSGIALILCVGMIFMPFSPRWLVQAGRSNDARQVLIKFREPHQIEPELHDIEVSLEMQHWSADFAEMFARRYFRRTTVGILLMIALQMTGASLTLPYLSFYS